jgi:acylphosphatase
MSSETCIRCTVHGRVQGVWFRGSTRDQARRLGVKGYARNLSDGTVEVMACGPGDAVMTLQTWLRSGPPSARVDDLRCTVVSDPVTNRTGFEIG